MVDFGRMWHQKRNTKTPMFPEPTPDVEKLDGGQIWEAEIPIWRCWSIRNLMLNFHGQFMTFQGMSKTSGSASSSYTLQSEIEEECNPCNPGR